MFQRVAAHEMPKIKNWPVEQLDPTLVSATPRQNIAYGIAPAD